MAMIEKNKIQRKNKRIKSDQERREKMRRKKKEKKNDQERREKM